MNRLAKGRRKELKVQKFLEKYGFLVFKPSWNKWLANKDIFNLFDLFAVHPILMPMLIQVKTHYSKATAAEIIEFANKYNVRHIALCLVVAEDRKPLQFLPISASKNF